MARLQHSFDFGRRGYYVLGGRDREVRLVDIACCIEETADRVWNQHRVLLNFRLSEGVHAFLENSDNRKRKATGQSDDLAYCCRRRTIQFLSKSLGNHTHFAAVRRVLSIEKPSCQDLEVAHAKVFCINTEY